MNNSGGRKIPFEEKYPNSIEIISFKAFIKSGRFNINSFLLENKHIERNKEYILRIYDILEEIFVDKTLELDLKGKKLTFKERFPKTNEITSYRVYARFKGESQGYFNVKEFLLKNNYLISNKEYLLRVYAEETFYNY